MNITLKEWREVETTFAGIKKAIEIGSCRLWEIASKYKLDTPEGKLLVKLWTELQDLRQEFRTTAELHPQSEWMGGPSDDPKNHKLREPNICPLPRRKFTEAEIAEAGAVCLGPVQWRYDETQRTTEPDPA